MIITLFVFGIRSALAHNPIYLHTQTQFYPDPQNWSGYRYCEVVAAWLEGLSVNRNAYGLIIQWKYITPSDAMLVTIIYGNSLM
jgi:hypothetical protein